MKSKNKLLVLFTITMLVGVSSLGASSAKGGMPDRVLSGEFGNRLFLLDCLFDTLNGVPCDDLYASASEFSYVFHGWGTAVGQEMGSGQAFTFELFVDGEPMVMRRFGVPFVNEDGSRGVNFFFSHIFQPGDLSEGVHSILGVWDAKNDGPYYAPTNLIVFG